MTTDMYEGINNRLKSRLFGLLRERERGRNWIAFLDNIIIELEGYPEELRSINYYVLTFKLNSLRHLDSEHFRSTIFDAMSLLGKMNDDIL